MPRVRKHAWLIARGIFPGAAVAALGVPTVFVGFAPESWKPLGVPLVFALGVVAGVCIWKLFGYSTVARQVHRARSAWAQSRDDVAVAPDGPADPRDTALALPGGWTVELARGRVQLDVSGTLVRAETWQLQPLPLVRRMRERREVVMAPANTGTMRLCVELKPHADGRLVRPAWVSGRAQVSSEWDEPIRQLVSSHQDVYTTLTIGDGRVILLANDDPRPETTLRRAQLVRDVATLIG